MATKLQNRLCNCPSIHSTDWRVVKYEEFGMHVKPGQRATAVASRLIIGYFFNAWPNRHSRRLSSCPVLVVAVSRYQTRKLQLARLHVFMNGKRREIVVVALYRLLPLSRRSIAMADNNLGEMLCGFTFIVLAALLLQ